MKEKMFSVMLIVSLVIVILSTAYYMVSFRSSIYPSSDHINVRNYLQGKEDLQVDMTEDESAHLRDVKKVMQAIAIITFLAVVRAAVGVFALRNNRKQLLRCLFLAGVSVAVIIGLIGLIGGFSFSFLFEYFHKIFFPQGNWTFPANSVLITLFPIKFFIMRFIEIIVASLGVASIFIGVSVYLERKKW